MALSILYFKHPNKHNNQQCNIKPNVKKNPIHDCIYYDVTYEFQSESTLHNLPQCQGTPCSKQAPYSASLGKWFSVHLRTKWLWVRIPLLSLFQSMLNLK